MQHTLTLSMIETLRQGEELLRALTDDQYIQTVPEAFSSCIGSHYRHSLEHYVPLLTGKPTDQIDYDARERNPQIETNRIFALEQTQKFREAAEQMDSDLLSRQVQVCCSVSADSESPVVPSSLGREVMYAVIHSVHHYAIIKMMCSILELDLPKGFGVAPSTIRHREHSAPAG